MCNGGPAGYPSAFGWFSSVEEAHTECPSGFPWQLVAEVRANEGAASFDIR